MFSPSRREHATQSGENMSLGQCAGLSELTWALSKFYRAGSSIAAPAYANPVL
jgi:hypothetical protein